MFWTVLVSLGLGVLTQNWWIAFVMLISSIIFQPRKTGTPLA